MQKKIRRPPQPRELTDFGVWVKHRLVDRQMTSVELCKNVGIPCASYLSKILHGEINGGKYIDKITDALQEDKKRMVG